ncbi:MAG: DUF1330 domain-containing protein [Burkholderiales bacterium]
MNRIIVAALVGISLGASIMTGVLAQGKEASVLVIDEVEASDPQADAKIAPLFRPVAAAFGGRYLVRGGKTVSFSGKSPKRVVVMAFDSMEKARAWRESPRHKELEQMREKIGTKIRSYAVEAIAR